MKLFDFYFSVIILYSISKFSCYKLYGVSSIFDSLFNQFSSRIVCVSHLKLENIRLIKCRLFGHPEFAVTVISWYIFFLFLGSSLFKMIKRSIKQNLYEKLFIIRATLHFTLLKPGYQIRLA